MSTSLQRFKQLKFHNTQVLWQKYDILSRSDPECTRGATARIFCYNYLNLQ